MVAKSGDPLLQEDAVEALGAELLPLARLVTPNVPEAERLTGLPAKEGDQRRRCALHLAARGPAVLLKGGHGKGRQVVDLLCEKGRFQAFEHPRIETRAIHGTGCTLSSAIAARLAAGMPLAEAVGGGIDFLQGAMAAAYPLGRGHGPVNHLFRLFPSHD